MPKTKLPTMKEGIAILNTDKVEKLNHDLEEKMQEYHRLSLLEHSLTNGNIVGESQILDESVIKTNKEFGELKERFKKQATKYLNKPASTDDSIDDAYNKMEQALKQAQAIEKQQNAKRDCRPTDSSKEIAALPNLLKKPEVSGKHTQNEMNRRNNRVNNVQQLSK